MKRTEMNYEHIDSLAKNEVELDSDVKEQVEIQIKYEGYIEKSLQQVERLKKMEDKKIPENIDYDAIGSLATEADKNLKKYVHCHLLKLQEFLVSTLRIFLFCLFT